MRHIFADDAVAACCRLREHSLPVGQYELEAVELMFGDVRELRVADILRREMPIQPLLPFAQLGFGEHISQGPLSNSMLHFRECGTWAAAHLVRDRTGFVGRTLERTKLGDERVIRLIRYLRRILLVISPLVVRHQLPQLPHPLCFRILLHTGKSTTGRSTCYRSQIQEFSQF